MVAEQHEHELPWKTRKIQEHKHAICTSAGPHPVPLLDQGQPAAHCAAKSLHLRQLMYAEKLLYACYETKILYVCIEILSLHLGRATRTV